MNYSGEGSSEDPQPQAPLVQPRPRAPTVAPPSAFETEVLSTLRELRSGQNAMRGAITQMQNSIYGFDGRLSKVETDLARLGYPMYDWAYRSNLTPPHAEPPSFYTPRPENIYDIDLSRGFGGLRLVDDAGHTFRFANSPTVRPAPGAAHYGGFEDDEMIDPETLLGSGSGSGAGGGGADNTAFDAEDY